MSSSINPVLFFLASGPKGSSWGNFTPPNHPHQMLIMKQGNSPETATASRIRAELRQEENAGWDTWGRKARTATEHSGNTTGTTQQQPQSLKWQQLKRPEKSNKPWQQVGPAALSLSYLPRLKLPKEKKKNKHKEASVSKTTNQPLNYSGVDQVSPFGPTLYSGNIFFNQIREKIKNKEQMSSGDFL